MTDSTDRTKDPDFQRHTYKVLTANAVFLVALGTIIFSLLEDWSIVDSSYDHQHVPRCPIEEARYERSNRADDGPDN